MWTVWTLNSIHSVPQSLKSTQKTCLERSHSMDPISLPSPTTSPTANAIRTSRKRKNNSSVATPQPVDVPDKRHCPESRTPTQVRMDDTAQHVESIVSAIQSHASKSLVPLQTQDMSVSLQPASTMFNNNFPFPFFQHYRVSETETNYLILLERINSLTNSILLVSNLNKILLANTPQLPLYNYIEELDLFLCEERKSFEQSPNWKFYSFNLLIMKVLDSKIDTLQIPTALWGGNWILSTYSLLDDLIAFSRHSLLTPITHEESTLLHSVLCEFRFTYELSICTHSNSQLSAFYITEHLKQLPPPHARPMTGTARCITILGGYGKDAYTKGHGLAYEIQREDRKQDGKMDEGSFSFTTINLGEGGKAIKRSNKLHAVEWRYSGLNLNQLSIKFFQELLQYVTQPDKKTASTLSISIYLNRRLFTKKTPNKQKTECTHSRQKGPSCTIQPLLAALQHRLGYALYCKFEKFMMKRSIEQFERVLKTLTEDELLAIFESKSREQVEETLKDWLTTAYAIYAQLPSH